MSESNKTEARSAATAVDHLVDDDDHDDDDDDRGTNVSGEAKFALALLCAVLMVPTLCALGVPLLVAVPTAPSRNVTVLASMTELLVCNRTSYARFNGDDPALSPRVVVAAYAGDMCDAGDEAAPWPPDCCARFARQADAFWLTVLRERPEHAVGVRRNTDGRRPRDALEYDATSLHWLGIVCVAVAACVGTLLCSVAVDVFATHGCCGRNLVYASVLARCACARARGAFARWWVWRPSMPLSSLRTSRRAECSASTNVS